jgi:formylglycine-generating enzyme required for sulfatase activity
MKTRVVRGGSWVSFVPSRVRAASRNWNAVSSRSFYLGFRCARVEVGP